MDNNGSGQFGGGTLSQTNRPTQIIPTNVVAIAGGDYHSMYLKSDGSLWTVGGNYYVGGGTCGQLGDGFINTTSLMPEQIVPTPQPFLTNGVSLKTNLQISAACQFGGTFYLLAGTNLTQPLSQWLAVATNTISNRTNNVFKATLTNAVNSSKVQQFYILQSK